ncbi:MAG TPA: c-type cytochrome [Puia sp.]|jgi:mono/diheme cytochrome c family protein
MNRPIILFFIVACVLACSFACDHPHPAPSPSPSLTADSAILKMHVDSGFAIKLVAAEPLIAAPVALSFDEKGRIWVVEMMAYMPDTSGTGEDAPTGKVVILSDKNGDGLMDDSKVFLDSLVLPRAICLIDSGILVAEPPKLWYYKISNDKPVGKTLVDSDYAAGGNVEHQPNGLFRALDNWIYNAKSAKRYKKYGDHWLIEKTHFRGQWGITQDNAGHLYYNTNSENLLGDYFPPGLGAANEHQRTVAGFSEHIVSDNRVYPARPNTGVNRGYQQGILDDSGRLREFTAACGPVIYNGSLFPKAYEDNAFVAEPAANLVKRDILTTTGYITTGREADGKKEFLASEDERFRPVNLYTGPDGALYIVDMYRGIIQHKTYLTPYLKNEIKDRALTKPLNCGRIYKVLPANTTTRQIIFPNDPDSLVQLLQDPNGVVRSKAQQLLVDSKNKRVVPALKQFLKNTQAPIPLIHALWTLEGLKALQKEDILPLLQNPDWTIRQQALTLINNNNYRPYLPALKKLIDNEDTLAAPYIAFSINDPQLQARLRRKYPHNIYVADAIISNLYNKEAQTLGSDTTLALNRRLKKVLADVEKAKNNSNQKSLAKKYPRGATIFQTVCQACHGADGNGTTALAPPLNGSNWVQGDKNKLIPIVLYGLTGPVRIAGKLYKSPEINGDMPGIGSNKDFSDEDISQVLSFIRSSWNNKAGGINAADIGPIREKYKDRQKPFTMEELDH